MQEEEYLDFLGGRERGVWVRYSRNPLPFLYSKLIGLGCPNFCFSQTPPSSPNPCLLFSFHFRGKKRRANAELGRAKSEPKRRGACTVQAAMRRREIGAEFKSSSVYALAMLLSVTKDGFLPRLGRWLFDEHRGKQRSKRPFARRCSLFSSFPFPVSSTNYAVLPNTNIYMYTTDIINPQSCLFCGVRFICLSCCCVLQHLLPHTRAKLGTTLRIQRKLTACLLQLFSFLSPLQGETETRERQERADKTWSNYPSVPVPGKGLVWFTSEPRFGVCCFLFLSS
ncbi:hypothetical protein B0H63DRAFT_218457 [Podospora didyma]|uniref:Uncharacterized protein n=1 Tax=Podospora didyma TaxID=330526 RepID=A0AAE0NID5_9PEZI|nr:hypothetical protein B0H63DRAFT_218457 [Podospora didyma]